MAIDVLVKTKTSEHLSPGIFDSSTLRNLHNQVDAKHVNRSKRGKKHIKEKNLNTPTEILEYTLEWHAQSGHWDDSLSQQLLVQAALGWALKADIYALENFHGSKAVYSTMSRVHEKSSDVLAMVQKRLRACSQSFTENKGRMCL